MEWSVGNIQQSKCNHHLVHLSSSVIIHHFIQDQKMEGLVVQLDNYSRLGIPKLQHLTVFPDPAEDLVEEALYSLEDNWTDIVERHAGLSERLKAQQTALWELISTELAYIRTLKVIQDVSEVKYRIKFLQ